MSFVNEPSTTNNIRLGSPISPYYLKLKHVMAIIKFLIQLHKKLVTRSRHTFDTLILVFCIIFSLM